MCTHPGNPGTSCSLWQEGNHKETQFSRDRGCPKDREGLQTEGQRLRAENFKSAGKGPEDEPAPSNPARPASPQPGQSRDGTTIKAGGQRQRKEEGRSGPFGSHEVTGLAAPKPNEVTLPPPPAVAWLQS